jgi:hypothetical protein
MSKHHFTETQILTLLQDSVGNWDDNLEAHLSFEYDGQGTATVSATRIEDNEDDEVTERFRITVERIRDDQ